MTTPAEPTNTPVTPGDNVKPGYLTTEFWLTVLAVLVGLALVLTNHLEATTYWPWAMGAGGAYAIGRGLAKKGP